MLLVSGISDNMMFNPVPRQDPNFRWPLQCIWLKLNGSWPLRPKPIRSIWPDAREYVLSIAYTLWALYLIVSVGITISFQTAFLINNLGNIIMLTENCCTTFMGVLNFVRLVHLRMNQSKFRELINQFVIDIWIPDNTNRSIAKECRRRMITFQVMTLLLACLILMYCLLPLIELFWIIGIDVPIKPFPYKMEFPFDPYSSWIIYVLTYLFTAYAGICVVTTLFAEDSLFGFFITYLCGQFRLLHQRIDSLGELSKYERSLGKHWEEQLHLKLFHEVKSICEHHNRLISFAQQLEDFFNPILLVNLTISALLICMVGFQLMTSKYLFVGDYVKFVVYISSAMSQLYILCANGDTLIQHSTSTAIHLYTCRWENISYNKQFRTSLRFMILCSQRPVIITAFKFSTLSLQSFTAILSTSMSYFTLLRSIYFDN